MGTEGFGRQMTPPPENYLGVKHGILIPQIFGKEMFAGRQVS